MRARRLGIDHEGLARYLGRLERRVPIAAAILFGSRARGNELVDSDYDLLIVSDGFAGMAAWDRVQACLDLWEQAEPLEVVALTRAELARRRDEIGIVGEALREGLTLRGEP